MPYQHLCVVDATDPESVLATMQRSLEVVSTPESIQNCKEDPHVQEYQYVHWEDGQSAFGVTTMMPARRMYSGVFLLSQVYYGKRMAHKIERNPPLTPEFLDHLVLEFTCPDWSAQASIVYEPLNDWYIGSLEVPYWALAIDHNLRYALK